MGFFSALFSKRLVGLDIGTSGIKAVELKGGKNPRLVAYNRLTIPKGVVAPDGEIIDRKILIHAIRNLFKNSSFTTKKVAIGTFGNSIIMKKITIPKMSNDEIEHQLYWEIEQYIPNSAEVNLDFVVLGELPQSKLEVLLIAAKKDYINNLASVIEEAGLVIEAIDNYAFALGNVFEFNYGHVHSSALSNVIIDIGAMSTKFIVIEKDKTTFGRELRIGGNSCTELICEHMGLEFKEAEQQKISGSQNSPLNEVINMWNKRITEEIGKTLDFYISQNKNVSLDALYLCGGASQTVGLIDYLKSQTTIQVKQLKPFQNISGAGLNIRSSMVKELKFFGALSIGLALRLVS